MILLTRFKEAVLAVSFLMVAACSIQAATIYVDSTAVGADNGSSWTDAFNDLQDALGASVSGDEIWVANGTYYPGDSGIAVSSFFVKNGVSIFGGFEGAGGAEETALSQRDFVANLSILTGDLDSSGAINPGDAYHVVTAINTDTTAIMDGFVITGGNANGAGADNRGGGVQAFVGGLTLNNSVVTGNGGVFGAGLRSGRTLNLFNVQFRNNVCTNRGGAIYATGTGPTQAYNCTFYANESPSLAAGFWVQGTNTAIRNCSFSKNDGSQGSAIYNFQGGTEVTNCIMWDNPGTDISGTAPNLTTCIVEGGYGPGTNVLDVDPLFADTLLRLKACSPAVDAGDSLLGIVDDLEGNARPFDGDGDAIAKWDLGAFESQVMGIVPSVQSLLGQLPGCVTGNDFPYTVSNNLAPANTYLWTLIGGGNIDAGGDSSVVLIDWGAATGSFEIYLTETVASTGCFRTDTFAIAVDTVPTVSLVPTGGDSLCDGDSLLLTAAGAGASFQWLLDGNVIPTANNAQFYATDDGAHNVVLTDGNGCFDTATVNFDLLVHPLPLITFSTSVSPALCIGDSVTLTAPVGISQQWYENGVLRPGDTLDNITVSTAGLYNMIQTDANGCIDSAATGQDVAVNPLPVVSVSPASVDTLCPGDSLALNGTANGAASFQWTLDGQTVAGATSNPYFGNQSGLYNVLLTDTNNCVDSANTGHRLLIGDFVDPVAICQDTTVYLDANGNIALDGTFVDNGSNDNCVVDSIGLAQTVFTCVDTGTQAIAVTIFDGVGNTATCTSQITIEDSIRPVAVCNDTTLYLDGNGALNLLPADIDGGSSDNCGIATYLVSQTAFACTDTGLHVVTLTLIDVSGNVNQCTAQVTLADSTAPIPQCVDTLVVLDGGGNASISVPFIENGSSDNCGIDTFFLDQTQFGCSDVPSVNVTLTMVDVSGNLATCTQTVRVRDTVSPIAICNDTVIYIDNSGQALLTPADVDGGSSDNCGIAFSNLGQNLFTCLDTGLNAVTVSFADADTNIASCISNITILDTVNPVAACSDTTFYLDSFGVALVDPFVFGLNSTDNCTFFDTIYVDAGPFACSDTGTHVVNLFLADISGKADSCSGVVTIADSTGPFALCRDTSLILNPTGIATLQLADIDLGTVDNCTLDTIFIDRDSFTCADAGIQVVTLTGIDIFGNVGTCTANVTIVDSVLPVAACRDTILYLDANGNATLQASDIDNGSSDNCGVDTLIFAQTVFSCVDTGTTALTLEVRDQFGNASTCSSNVTVLDSTAPTAVCQNGNVYLDANGVFNVTYPLVGGGSFDNCMIFNTSLSVGQMTCFNVGSNVVTVVVGDPSGNLDSCNAILILADTLSPIVDCPDTTLYLDVNGSLTITGQTIGSGTVDNCQVNSSTLSQSSFSCSDIGTQSISATFSDGSGNSSPCSLNLTILDSLPPVPQCADTTLVLDSMGMGSISLIQVNDSSYDACGIDTVFLNRINFDCNDLGGAAAVLTVIDIYGNVDSCTSVVTVVDTIAPRAICQDVTVYVDGFGNVAVGLANFDGGTFDECGLDTVITVPDAFSCGDFGFNNVVLSAQDNEGNIATCNTSLLILDTLEPIAVCDTITIQLTASGGAFLDPLTIAGASSDNCGFDSVWLSVDSVNCSDFGFVSVLVSLRDSSGNLNSCTAVVEVVDTTGISNILVDLGQDTTACNGDSIFLTPGGGFQSYQWSDLSGDTSLTVDSAGVYYVDVESTEGCFGTDTITILAHTVADPNLRTESGELVICNNDQLLLLADTGYVAYVWSTGSMGNTAIATTGGVYTLIVTDATGCELVQDISINYVPTPAPSPVITPPGPIDLCEGTDLILNAGSGYFAYLWTTGNTGQFQNIIQAGTYGVEVWNGFGCHAIAAPVEVTLQIAPLPALGQAGDTLLSVTPAAAYQWNFNGFPIPGANNSQFLPQASGNYTITLTYANGCDRTSLGFPVIVSVPEALLTLQGLDVYPNPTSGTFFLKSAVPLREALALRVVDAYGKVVYRTSFRRLMGEVAVELPDLPAGLYILDLEYQGERFSRRLSVGK